MTKLFQDKTVLITGASAGFGAAFARSFAKEGARLINVARRKERLEELEKELRSQYGVEVLSIAVDIANGQEVLDRLSKLPKEFAAVDILINNAGLALGMDKLWEVQIKDWDQVIDVNIKGLLAVSSQIIPRMLKANRGHIINLGSVAGHEAYPGGSVYCATKFAVRAITDALRKELVATPIRVSMISPGMAKTEFSNVRFHGDQAKADAVYANIEALTPEDIAEIVLFIASRPAHVDIADLIVYPTNQASPTLVHRAPSN